MRTRVQKWGNDLALRIPKSFAEKVGLQIGSAAEVSLADGKLVVAPITQGITQNCRARSRRMTIRRSQPLDVTIQRAVADVDIRREHWRKSKRNSI